jgi:anti-anti-sigma factor
MSRIDLSSRVSPGYVVVALRGELDVSGAASTRRALAGAAAPRSRVITDLAELTFMDGRGVEAAAGGDGRGPAPVALTAELAGG